MLQQGIIEPSKGAYSSNIVLVRKKDGSIRPCIDLRQLNQQVRDSGNMDIYPLPNMGACLDSMGRSKWFSTFDLKAGFHQIEIYPPDAPKTTFLTRKGAWQYKRVPMGQCNTATDVPTTHGLCISRSKFQYLLNLHGRYFSTFKYVR